MFLSLPCAIGENGITQIVRMHITEYEKKLFQTSADIVYKVQKDINIKTWTKEKDCVNVLYFL